MKKENTSDRLKHLMNERGFKQVDILNLCKPYCDKYGVKMNKSDISQYVSGKVEPGQEKLVILGMALGVTEAWLLGYDVEKARKKLNLDEGELDAEIVSKIYLLNNRDKELILGMIDNMLNKK